MRNRRCHPVQWEMDIGADRSPEAAEKVPAIPCNRINRDRVQGYGYRRTCTRDPHGQSGAPANGDATIRGSPSAQGGIRT